MKKITAFIMAAALLLSLAACSGQSAEPAAGTAPPEPSPTAAAAAVETSSAPEGFVFIQGGSFQMGSPESEAWRSDDETAHTVTVSDFYISAFELTAAEYQALMGSYPGSFSGEGIPADSISWLDAIAYCNARSEAEGLRPAYELSEGLVTWDREAEGYRLPTEAEWEYACRAGTVSPFNTQTSISADEANYWGDYPYMIEDNYFTQSNLETRPGIYRQSTVAVSDFEPNPWGLYNMHGNVAEWVWDYYGGYDAEPQTDPTGAGSGTRRVYRGGGWNDFAKNLRSAYRAAAPAENSSASIGMRLARNAAAGSGTVSSSNPEQAGQSGGNILIAYFSWSGNTRGIAQEIAEQTGAELFEIQMVTPYSTDYNTVLDQAQQDQNQQARPELSSHVENMEDYDIIILGYPNWWASIPMPVASFLEEYDLSGKTILPFCSHGGGRFGQSLTAIAKLAPEATLAEGLAISYSGGAAMAGDVTAWLSENGIELL